MTAGGEPRLQRGDLLPRVISPPPGPRSRNLGQRARRAEAPGINTLSAAGEGAMVWREALGANVLDVDDNVFIDLTSGFGVASVGHRAPTVLAAAHHQAQQLVHGLGDVYSHPTRIELAERLAERAPLPGAQVYFATSGADAVEIALKTACLFTGRRHILAFDPGYHGLTLGALRVTSRPAFREPFLPHDPLVVRAPFGCAPQRLEECLRGGTIGAVVVEPIVGREGILLPPAGWLQQLAELCQRHGSLLVADEVFVGFGRTGPWFVCTEEGVEPDLVCCGKALGGGYPIAAVLGRAEILEAWRVPGEALHTATFTAHPVACAAALATLELLDELLPSAPRRIEHELGKLASLARASGFELRGRGALWALAGPQAGALARALLARGIIALAGGPAGDVLQLVPPLVITDAQLAATHEILRAALGDLA